MRKLFHPKRVKYVTTSKFHLMKQINQFYLSIWTTIHTFMGKDRKKRRLNAEALLLQSSQTKRLLIFDLNKVLVSKLKNTSIFTIRPFAAEFLHDLSQEYILAVWTSMKKNTAKKIIKSLFQYEAQTKSKSTPKLSQNISSSSSNLSTLSALPLPSLLFKWTQNKCTVSVGSSSRREDEDDIQLDNIARSTRTEIETESVKIENHTHNEAQINNQEQHEVNESKDYDEDCGNEMTESTMVFAKDLTKVWTEFPQYHQFTTVRLQYIFF